MLRSASQQVFSEPPLGAVQGPLEERLAALGLNPAVLHIVTTAIRRGKWYDTVQDLQDYFRTDSFETIVEEVQELGLDVNQAKSFVRRVKRELVVEADAEDTTVRRSPPSSDPPRRLRLASPSTSP